MKLDGPDLLVLRACHALPKDQFGYVSDAAIAQETRLRLPDVQATLEILDGEGLVSKVRLSDDHYAAQITSRGALELSGRYPPFAGSKGDPIPIKVVPKGLRSFDAEDKNFFLDLSLEPCGVTTPPPGRAWPAAGSESCVVPFTGRPGTR